MRVRNQFYLVGDLERAWHFYTLLLGPGTRRNGYLLFCPEGAVFHFYALSPEQREQYRFAAQPGEVWSGCCLESPDWEQRLASLQAAGARLLTPWEPLAWGGGWGCQLLDPEGHRWELTTSA